MTRIKICGLTEIEHALAAAEAGADFVGVVFAEGRRKLTPEKAREIAIAVHSLEKPTQVVGVFARYTAAEANRIAEHCGLDRVQLAGDESWSFCLQIAHPITKTVHVGPETTAEQVLAQIIEGSRALRGRDISFLLDTKLGNASGGTGHRFDWSIVPTVARRFSVIIAGGLTPDNVAQAIKTINPWGVDVSTGVETGGVKDLKKIKQFIEAVRKTDAGTR